MYVLQHGASVGLRGFAKGMAQMGSVVDCSKAQTLLSDLLDVRRGECPTSMESPLGDPQALKALEQHLAHCGTCKQELHELEELGLAFSEFNLEEPDASHFAGYGRMVHERVRRMTQRTAIRPAMRAGSPWRTWLSTVAASAAAAVLAVLLLGPRAQTTPTRVGVAPEPPIPEHGSEAEAPAEVSLPANVLAPKQPAIDFEMVDLPKFEPRSLPMQLWTEQGAQLVTLTPQADNTYPVADLQRFGRVVLGDPPQNESRSSGLVGIAFVPVLDDVGGLQVVAVKRGGPADVIGLRPDDRLLSLNGTVFPESSPTEILKFFNGVSGLGQGKVIQVDFARKKGSDWIVKRGRGELGKFK